jgi:hypothetical protein
MEGLFREARALAVPDSAIPIDSRSEAPEGAQIVTGERGGLYYIPAGATKSDDSSNGGPADASVSREKLDDLKQRTDSPEEFGQEVVDEIGDGLGIEVNDIEGENITERQAEAIGASMDMLTRANEERMNNLGSFLDDTSRSQLDEGLRVIDNQMAGNHAQYNSQHKFIEVNINGFEDIDPEDTDLLVAREDSFLEDILIHEIGHALHHQAVDEQGGSLSDIRDIDIPEDRIKEEISPGAAMNPTEAAAEMFLYQSLGNDLPDDLQDVYDNDLQAPEPVDLT